MATDPLDKTRKVISKKVRRLRTDRRFTQTELANMLGMSQNRLSEVELGKGSFTAEQLIAIIKLFNVPLSHFAPMPVPVGDDLQNTLAQFGGSHLFESNEVLPSERLRDVMTVIRETLIYADSPRNITALGPVLVNHSDKLNLGKLRLQLVGFGMERRLGWVVDSTVDALRSELSRKLPRAVGQRYARAMMNLDGYVNGIIVDTLAHTDEHVLDSDIRTEDAKQMALSERSE